MCALSLASPALMFLAFDVSKTGIEFMKLLPQFASKRSLCVFNDEESNLFNTILNKVTS